MLVDIDYMRASVSDIGKTRSFYKESLGLPEIKFGTTELPACYGKASSEAVIYQVGPTLVEFFQVPDGKPAGLVQHLGLKSDNFDSDREKLAQIARIHFTDQPAPSCAPGLVSKLNRKTAWFTDPYGLNLTLVEVNEDRKENGPLKGIDHIKVNCTTFEDGNNFYQNELGAKAERFATVKDKETKSESEFVLLSIGRTRIELTGSGQYAKGEKLELGYLGHMGWLCEDPLAYYNELKSRGIRSFSENTKNGPKYNPQGHVFRRYKFDVNDPDTMLVQMVKPLPDVDPDTYLDGENPDWAEPGRAKIIEK